MTTEKPANGDYRLKAMESLLRFGPSALILCFVLWFMGTHAIDIGRQLIVMQERQASQMGEQSKAVLAFAAAINAIAASNDKRGEREAREHTERLTAVNRLTAATELSTERRGEEIKLLAEILRQLQVSR